MLSFLYSHPPMHLSICKWTKQLWYHYCMHHSNKLNSASIIIPYYCMHASPLYLFEVQGSQTIRIVKQPAWEQWNPCIVNCMCEDWVKPRNLSVHLSLPSEQDHKSSLDRRDLLFKENSSNHQPPKQMAEVLNCMCAMVVWGVVVLTVCMTMTCMHSFSFLSVNFQCHPTYLT